MYAVIRTGGKQERVEEGQCSTSSSWARTRATRSPSSPCSLVDGDNVIAAADALAGATVTARVVGEVKGPKITGFTYKNKTNNRRRWGHRQRYDASRSPASRAEEGVTLSDDSPSNSTGDE